MNVDVFVSCGVQVAASMNHCCYAIVIWVRGCELTSLFFVEVGELSHELPTPQSTDEDVTGVDTHVAVIVGVSRSIKQVKNYQNVGVDVAQVEENVCQYLTTR